MESIEQDLLQLPNNNSSKRLLFTSYFAMSGKLPDYITPIAICGGIPDFWIGKLWTRKLAPRKWFFDEWKKNHDNDFYIRNFEKEVLSNLNPVDVLDTLYGLANQNKDGKIPCMICYEKPGDFCHRHLVAEWLNNSIPNLVDCREYIFNRKRNIRKNEKGN